MVTVRTVRQIILILYAIGVIILTVFWVPVRFQPVDKRIASRVQYCPIWEQEMRRIEWDSVPNGVSYSHLLAEMIAVTVVAGVAFLLTTSCFRKKDTYAEGVGSKTK
jgi:hypothetical protein